MFFKKNAVKHSFALCDKYETMMDFGYDVKIRVMAIASKTGLFPYSSL